MSEIIHVAGEHALGILSFAISTACVFVVYAFAKDNQKFMQELNERTKP